MSSINLTWDVMGYPDSYNIYRSTDPIDPNNLPIPLATNVITRSYNDISANTQLQYFYRIGSVKNGVIRVSDELVYGDKYWDKVVLYTRLNSSAVDLSSKANVPVVGSSVTYQSAKFGNGMVATGSLNSSIYYSLTNFGIADSQNFTIEAWVSFTAIPSTYYMAPFGNWGGNTGICIFVTTTGAIQTSINDGYIISGSAIAPNTFFHVAIVRNNNIVTQYVNGVSAGSTTHSNAIGAKNFYIGGNGMSTDWWNGIVDEVRVTIGVARYTSNFTPESKEFLYNPS